MLALLYATGLRVSELCRLQVGDLDASLGIVRVLGKGNKQRVVPLLAVGADALHAYLKSCPFHPGAEKFWKEKGMLK